MEESNNVPLDLGEMWDPRGDVEVSHIAEVTYEPTSTEPEPNISLRQGLNTLAENLTMLEGDLERREDRLDQVNRTELNGAGRGRALLRLLRNAGGPGSANVEQVEEEIQSDEERPYEEEEVDEVEDPGVPMVGEGEGIGRREGPRENMDQVPNPMVGHGEGQPPPERIGSDLTRLADEDHVGYGWWQWLQLVVGIFSAIYFLGPYRLYSFIITLPSYKYEAECALTCSSGLVLLIILFKIGLVLLRWILGEHRFLYMVYFICPSPGHKLLFSILGKKPGITDSSELLSSTNPTGNTRSGTNGSVSRINRPYTGPSGASRNPNSSYGTGSSSNVRPIQETARVNNSRSTRIPERRQSFNTQSTRDQFSNTRSNEGPQGPRSSSAQYSEVPRGHQSSGIRPNEVPSGQQVTSTGSTRASSGHQSSGAGSTRDPQGNQQQYSTGRSNNPSGINASGDRASPSEEENTYIVNPEAGGHSERNPDRGSDNRTPGSRMGEYIRQNQGTGSGGWNGGDFDASTPAPPSRNPVGRRNNNHNNHHSHYRNHRASRSFLGLRSQVDFDENRNQEHSEVEHTRLSELSVSDQDAISTHVESGAQAQNFTVPTFNGDFEQYGPFREEFMIILPFIHPKLRLKTLRDSLKNSDAKRCIEDFIRTDRETFCAALLELDRVYGDIDESIERLVDKIKGLMLIPHTEVDKEFISNFENITSLVKQLHNLKRDFTPLLDDYARREWAAVTPPRIFNVIDKKGGLDRKWLNFENLYTLCEDFVSSAKNNKALSQKRDKNYNAVLFKKHKHQVQYANGDLEGTPSSADEEELEVNFARQKRFFKSPSGIPRPVICCFCQSEQHLSTECTQPMTAEEKMQFFTKGNLRCYFCLEEGHSVSYCPILRLKMKAPFRCDCKEDKPAHAKILCDALKPRSAGS